MNANPLSLLVGRRIRAVKSVHDYLQIKFDSGEVLNIFNEYAIDGFVRSDVGQLTGLKLIAVLDIQDEIRLELSGARRLSVNMADAAFHGPEAMELIQTTGKRIIWP